MRIIRVGIEFWFEPEGEHQDIFENCLSEYEVIEMCKQLTAEDLQNLVLRGDTYQSLKVKQEWV